MRRWVQGYCHSEAACKNDLDSNRGSTIRCTSPMEKRDESRRSRRAVLKSLAVGAASATGVFIADSTASAFSFPFRPRPKPPELPKPFGAKVLVYRLKTRNTIAWYACQIHHRF